MKVLVLLTRSAAPEMKVLETDATRWRMHQNEAGDLTIVVTTQEEQRLPAPSEER